MKDASGSRPAARGALLVASEQLLDPNFCETLVYLVDHDAEGSLGLVLNRPSGKVLRDIVVSPEIPEVLAEVPVMIGGPVQRGQVLLALFDAGGDSCGVRCRIERSFEQIEAHLAECSGVVLAFSGYAGWSEGQLQGELRERAWEVRQPDMDMLQPDLLPGMWDVVHQGDMRWKRLLPYLPRDPWRN